MWSMVYGSGELVACTVVIEVTAGGGAAAGLGDAVGTAHQ